MNGKNVVLIVIDDMGWKDLSGFGSSFYESPNIDALMASGIQFTNAYAACPVCSPSRASILTGKYPARLGVTDWIDLSGSCHPCKGKLIDAPYLKHLPLEEYNLAACLKDRGYHTYHVGKWHLGEERYYPCHQGFDVNIGGCSLGHPWKGYFSPYQIENLSDGPEGEYLTDRLTDEAIRLIKRHDEKPFFLNLCHYTVHTPLGAKAEDIAYFEEKAKRLGLDKENPFILGDHFPTTIKADQRICRRVVQSDCVYAAMIRNLDQNIQKVVDALHQEQLLEETIIVFASDNGGLATAEGSPTCNAPAREGKGWMNEGGNRVPFFIVAPSIIRPGSVSDYPTTSTDIYPTILSLIDSPLIPEQTVDGVDLSPLFKGKKLSDRPLFWHYPHYGNQGGTPSGAVLLDGWKLIEFFEDMHLELYDIDADVSESHDVSKDHPEVVHSLSSLLHDWQRDVGAIFPQKNE